MRVLVTGAYGLIGSACLARLHAAGHDVVGAGRSIGAARQRFPYAEWIEADFLLLQYAEAWQPLLDSVDAVVNCVGVLQDGWRDDVQRIQQGGTVALFDGCLRGGVQRVVHISALGADAAGRSRFSRSKAAAETHLRTLALDWVILRPGLVLGSGVYGGTAMLRGIAAFPFVVPVFHADSRIQVVSLDDLAETVVRAVAPAAPARVSWDVAHPQVQKLADIVTAIRGWLGFPPRHVVRLPDVLAKVVGSAGDAIGWLGWRSPARATSFAQLADGVIGDPAPWMAATGIASKKSGAVARRAASQRPGSLVCATLSAEAARHPDARSRNMHDRCAAIFFRMETRGGDAGRHAQRRLGRLSVTGSALRRRGSGVGLRPHFSRDRTAGADRPNCIGPVTGCG